MKIFAVTFEVMTPWVPDDTVDPSKGLTGKDYAVGHPAYALRSGEQTVLVVAKDEATARAAVNSHAGPNANQNVEIRSVKIAHDHATVLMPGMQPSTPAAAAELEEPAKESEPKPETEQPSAEPQPEPAPEAPVSEEPKTESAT